MPHPEAAKASPSGETVSQDSAARPAPAEPGAVRVENLGGVDPDSAGILEPERGGLGLAMWQGTPRAVVETLLPQLPARIRSPAMRNLAERLLLSTAVAPRPADGADSATKSLMAMRVERLQAMGAVEKAAELLAAAPARNSDPDLARLAVDNMLLTGELGGVCAEVHRKPERLVEIYWQKVLVFCQVLEGKTDGAMFGADLLAESDGFADSAFLALIDRLTGRIETKLENLPHPSPLHLAMLRVAKLTVPADALEDAAPPILRSIALGPNATPDTRLEAAEQAAALGAVSPERLREIYGSVKFDPDELDKALTLASGERTPRGRALLYQAALAQSVPAAKAAVVQKALELAREDGRLLLTARVYQPMLAGLPISGELSWMAADVAHALYALGRPVPARAWLALLRDAAAGDAQALTRANALWALARLAGDESARSDEQAIDPWVAAQRALAPKEADHRLALAYTLFEAFGAPVPDRYWQGLLGAVEHRRAAMPSLALQRAFANAVDGGRRGETVLLALLALGPGGPAEASPALLRNVIEGLRRIQLEDAAHAIALEAAVATGL